MDKYEYKIRAEEIKTLIASGEFAEAVKIADTIDWHRVKSVMMLCTISDLYKINRRFQESKDILLMAYERHPGGRLIVYSLCELSIKMGEFVQAIEYYKEFVQIAPKDTGRYILQYKLYEAQDVSLEERIAVLEEFKKRDYREKWAYELAYLYHRVGLETKCVEECDEMILWFGEGRYVLKALELKQLHQPLSESQQEKYLQIKQAMEEQPEEEEDDGDSEEIPELEETEPEEMEPEGIYPEEMYPNDIEPEERYPEEMEPEEADGLGLYAESYAEPEEDMPEYYHEESEEVRPEEEFRVKTVDLGQYNTMNLQKELAESMREILGEDGNVQPENFFGGQAEALVGGSFTPEQEPDKATETVFRETERRIQEEQAESVPMKEKTSIPSAAVEEVFFEEDVKDILQQDTKRIDLGDTKEVVPGKKMIYQAGLPSRYADPQQDAPFYQADKQPEPVMQAAAGALQPEMAGLQMETVQPAQLQQGIAGAGTVQSEPLQPETIQAHPNLLKIHKPSGFEQMLSQEYDGQISLVVPSSGMVEKQITGQMNIADIMAEWERAKRANEEKRREDVRKRVQKHTGDMFSEFDEATKSGLLEQLEKAVMEAILKEAEQNATSLSDISEQQLDDIVKSVGRLTGAAAKPGQEERGKPEEKNLVNLEYMKTIAEMAGIDNFEEKPAESERMDFPEEMLPERELETGLSGERVPGDIFLPEEAQADGLPEEETEEPAGNDWDAAGAEEREAAAVEEAEQRAKADAYGEQKSQLLAPEVKELFGRFIHSRKSREQILHAVEVMSMDSYNGNVIVTGEEEAGTLELARNLVHMLQLVAQDFSGKVAKVSGKALNKKDVPATLDKLPDGALIIEHATGMSSNTAAGLRKALEKENRNIFVIMEGKRDEMNVFLHKNKFLLDNFNARIDIESLDDQALVEYAKQYAEEMEYSIDELGILALHTRIADMQTSDHEVTVAEVKDLVDDAIYFADKRNPKHFLDILLGKRYDEEDMVILREKDFMHY